MVLSLHKWVGHEQKNVDVNHALSFVKNVYILVYTTHFTRKESLLVGVLVLFGLIEIILVISNYNEPYFLIYGVITIISAFSMHTFSNQFIKLLDSVEQ